VGFSYPPSLVPNAPNSISPYQYYRVFIDHFFLDVSRPIAIIKKKARASYLKETVHISEQF